MIVQNLPSFNFVEINGMKLTDPAQAYTALWEALSGGKRVSAKSALKSLLARFDNRRSRKNTALHQPW